MITKKKKWKKNPSNINLRVYSKPLFSFRVRVRDWILGFLTTRTQHGSVYEDQEHIPLHVGGVNQEQDGGWRNTESLKGFSFNFS
jgi:hypothetical protein